MKKRVIAMMIAGAMAVGMLSGCGGGSDSSSESSSESTSGSTAEGSSSSTSESSGGGAADGETWLIGYSNRDDTDTYLKAVVDEFAKLVEADDRFELIATDSGADSQKQLEDLDSFLVQGVDVAILCPQDGDTVVDYVDTFNEEGVSVYCSSQAATGGDYTFVGASDYELGLKTAQYAYEHLEEGAKVLYLGGPLGYQTCIDRRQAMVDGLAERIQTDWDGNVINEDGDIEVLSWQQIDIESPAESAMQITEDWIQTFPEFDAIVSWNDTSALAAIEALKGAGIEGVMVCSIDGIEDALQAVKDGDMACTIMQSAQEQAQALYDAIVNEYEGGENPDTINPEVFTIDSSNVDEYL